MEPIPNWKMALFVLFGVLMFPVAYLYDKKRKYEMSKQDLKTTLFKQMFLRTTINK